MYRLATAHVGKKKRVKGDKREEGERQKVAGGGGGGGKE